MLLCTVTKSIKSSMCLEVNCLCRGQFEPPQHRAASISPPFEIYSPTAMKLGSKSSFNMLSTLIFPLYPALELQGRPDITEEVVSIPGGGERRSRCVYACGFFPCDPLTRHRSWISPLEKHFRSCGHVTSAHPSHHRETLCLCVDEQTYYLYPFF